MDMLKIKIKWLNCLWLLIPLLVWNIILAPKITMEQVISDSHSPVWLLMAENIIRVIVFAFPLLLPLQIKNGMSKTGLVIYLAGTLIYFASWIPIIWATDSVWSQSTIGLLVPRITPLLSFLGIALVGQSIPYAVMSVIFIALHTLHGIKNLGS
jgi:hypothetical protein